MSSTSHWRREVRDVASCVPRSRRPRGFVDRRSARWLPACRVGASWIAALCLVGGAATVRGDEPLDGASGRPLSLELYQPRSMLRSAATDARRARFTAIDVHVHGKYKTRQSPEALDEWVRVMDDQNIAACVSLDGGLGEQLEEHKKYLWTRYRDRFVIFANVDWQGAAAAEDLAAWDCQRPDFGRRMARSLREARDQGATGLKVFKTLGLEHRNPDGSLLRIDDERWDPIWKACGELGMPVLIHTADPAAFFLPVDRFNERWEELRRHPEWSYAAAGPALREELFAARNRVIRRHPGTTFIGAHMADSPEDLEQLASWLDACPNLVVELSARLAEIGRQPRAARAFFLRYQDRILFGTDGPRPPERMRPHWRLLETEDEYFPYAEDQFPPQGMWRIYGLGLPDDALRKIYAENAVRLIPGLAERWDRWHAR